MLCVRLERSVLLRAGEEEEEKTTRKKKREEDKECDGNFLCRDMTVDLVRRDRLLVVSLF